MDVHVFNSVDLSRYSFVPISDIIAKNVGLSSDENAFYIELNGEKYKFDRGDLIDPEFEIDTQNWNQYTVSDGKLHCETYCFIVNPVYTFAVILTEYSFDGEEFVLDNISLVPADEYLIKNETPSAEQNDTSASNIPAASPSRAPETSSGTNTNTNTNTKSPSSSALENNAVSDSSISVTSPIAGKPQPTPYDQRPKDRSEQNNTAGSGSEDGIFMNENISENLAHEISQRYAEAAENNKTTEVLSGPDESGPNESIVWDYDVRP